MEDRRCKLGLLGRLELVRLIERGSTLRAAAAAVSVAPATAQVVASLGSGDGGRAGVVVVFADQVLAAAVVSVGTERRGRASDPRCAREDELGPDAPDVADRPASLDDLEDPQAPRCVASAAHRAPGNDAAL